jgi:hypothetical protein
MSFSSPGCLEGVGQEATSASQFVISLCSAHHKHKMTRQPLFGQVCPEQKSESLQTWRQHCLVQAVVQNPTPPCYLPHSNQPTPPHHLRNFSHLFLLDRTVVVCGPALAGIVMPHYICLSTCLSPPSD